MNKLIPKYQSPWQPIDYKPPENFEPKSTKYNTKNTPTILDVQDERTKLKYAQMSGMRHMLNISQKEPVSGTDPVGEFIVAGEVLGGLNPLGKILFPYAARFTSGPVRNWIASKALNDVLAKDALTGGVNKVVLNNGNILLQLASHSTRKPRQLRIEPQGNNAFRVHASTWGGLTDIEKKLLYEALYKELPENAKILFPESNPDYLATRGTVAGLLRLKRDPRFTPGSTLQKLMYKDKDGSIKFFEGTIFTKNSELQPKNIFRTIGYKGGNIKDKYSAFFTTDPRYAKQYGKVQKYLIESDNFNVAGEPLIGTRDPVGMDMFIYQNTRNNPNSKLIIGHDVITDEFPYLSKGTEMLSLSPNNYTSIKVNKPKTSLAFFENSSKNTVNITPGIPLGKRDNFNINDIRYNRQPIKKTASNNQVKLTNEDAVNTFVHNVSKYFPNLVSGKVEYIPNSSIDLFSSQTGFHPMYYISPGEFNSTFMTKVYTDRLSKLGYKLFEPIPIKEKGFTVIKKPFSRIIDNNNKKSLLGYFDNKNTGGMYSSTLDLSAVSPETNLVVPSVSFHERNMHGTDNVIDALNAWKPYNEFLDKLYNEEVIIDGVPYYFLNDIKDLNLLKESANKEELRATIGEYVRKLYYEIRKAYYPNKSASEIDPNTLKPVFEKAVDNMPEEVIKEGLKNINGYGADYVKLSKNNPNFTSDLKNLIKFGYGLIPLTVASSTNKNKFGGKLIPKQ